MNALTGMTASSKGAFKERTVSRWIRASYFGRPVSLGRRKLVSDEQIRWFLEKKGFTIIEEGATQDS